MNHREVIRTERDAALKFSPEEIKRFADHFSQTTEEAIKSLSINYIEAYGCTYARMEKDSPFLLGFEYFSFTPDFVLDQAQWQAIVIGDGLICRHAGRRVWVYQPAPLQSDENYRMVIYDDAPPNYPHRFGGNFPGTESYSFERPFQLTRAMARFNPDVSSWEVIK